MEATRGNGYAPAWGSLVMMMIIIMDHELANAAAYAQVR